MYEPPVIARRNAARILMGPLAAFLHVGRRVRISKRGRTGKGRGHCSTLAGGGSFSP